MNGNNTYLHQGEQNKRKRKEKNIKAFKNINTINISNRTKFELFLLIIFYTSGKVHNQLEYIEVRDKYRFPL